VASCAGCAAWFTSLQDRGFRFANVSAASARTDGARIEAESEHGHGLWGTAEGRAAKKVSSPTRTQTASCSTSCPTTTRAIVMPAVLPFGSLEMPVPGFGCVAGPLATPQLAHLSKLHGPVIRYVPRARMVVYLMFVALGTPLTAEEAEPVLLKALELGCMRFYNAAFVAHCVTNQTTCGIRPSCMPSASTRSSSATSARSTIVAIRSAASSNVDQADLRQLFIASKCGIEVVSCLGLGDT
jgi:hypothetical protein